MAFLLLHDITAWIPARSGRVLLLVVEIKRPVKNKGESKEIEVQVGR